MNNCAKPLQTTQRAPIEPLLAHLRSRRARPWVRGRRVLDFGCGASLWNLRAIQSIALERIGFDRLFWGNQPERTPDGILLVGSLADVEGLGVDCIVALACFEHLEPAALVQVLSQLLTLTEPEAILFGTVPTPHSKPVLEFLSYRLGLIDRSQIEDHQVYYDRDRLSEVVAEGGWHLTRYGRFQLGMNSWFTLGKGDQQEGHLRGE
jgi:hypothetical protein